MFLKMASIFIAITVINSIEAQLNGYKLYNSNSNSFYYRYEKTNKLKATFDYFLLMRGTASNVAECVYHCEGNKRCLMGQFDTTKDSDNCQLYKKPPEAADLEQSSNMIIFHKGGNFFLILFCFFLFVKFQFNNFVVQVETANCNKVLTSSPPANGFVSLSSELVNTTKLDYNSNEIDCLSPNVFGAFTSLKSLVLHRNFIKTLDNELKNLAKLTKLDLSYNMLKQINDDTFAGSVELVSIRFSNNYISLVQVNAFQGLSKLNAIDFSYNKLKDFETKTFAGTSLTYLYLDYNQFSSMDNFTTRPGCQNTINSLKYVTLIGNSYEMNLVGKLKDCGSWNEIEVIYKD
jgi:Leucine-rich repeat (LRR) protein